ncbi:hypothetical protein Tco_1466165 [Tanacetum coccineum]
MKKGDSTTRETTTIQIGKEFHQMILTEGQGPLPTTREEGRPSTQSEALNKPDASSGRKLCKKNLKLFIRTKHGNWCHYQESDVAYVNNESRICMQLLKPHQRIICFEDVLERTRSHKQEKITLFCDNPKCNVSGKNPAYHSKTKHIRVSISLSIERKREEGIGYAKIHTDDNVADYIMKEKKSNQL